MLPSGDPDAAMGREVSLEPEMGENKATLTSTLISAPKKTTSSSCPPFPHPNYHEGEDVFSAATMSTSDSKSYRGGTVFTAPLPQSEPSRCSTPPAKSPFHIPVRHVQGLGQATRASVMDADLRGIGIEADHLMGQVCRDRSCELRGTARHARHHQRPSLVDAELDTDVVTLLQLPPPRSVSQIGKDTEDHEDISSSCSKAYELQRPTLPVVYEGPSPPGLPGDQSDEETEHSMDLALERTAEEALQRLYGITLNRLKRPIRVISAFEDFRDACGSIMKSEEIDTFSDIDSEESDFEDGMGTATHGAEQGEHHGTWRAETIGPGSSRESSRINGTQKGKEKARETGSDYQPAPGTKVTSRQQKSPISTFEFSCPFRKRNPLRFNVRDHKECVLVFHKTFSSLKKHIVGFHINPAYRRCLRCQEEFRTAHQVQEHLQWCSHPPPAQAYQTDPEDGISDEIENLLRSREGSKRIHVWSVLWRTLFPTDLRIGAPEFEPPIEHHEVRHTYNYQRGSGRNEVEELLIRSLNGLLQPDQIRQLSLAVDQVAQRQFQAATSQDVVFRTPGIRYPPDRLIATAQSPWSDYVDVVTDIDLSDPQQTPQASSTGSGQGWVAEDTGWAMPSIDYNLGLETEHRIMFLSDAQNAQDEQNINMGHGEASSTIDWALSMADASPSNSQAAHGGWSQLQADPNSAISDLGLQDLLNQDIFGRSG